MKPPAKHKGFSQLDLLLILLALAGIVLVILPGLMRSQARSSRINCVNNLKQTGLGFRIWAGDNNDKYPQQTSVTNGGAMEWAEQGSAYHVVLVMSNELSTPKVLFCPEETNPQRRAANTFSSTPVIGNPATVIPFTATNSLSYFVGLDADETQPNGLLSGDDHLLVNNAKPRPGLLSLATNTPISWAKGRHKSGGSIGAGNLGLADGSVQQVLSSRLPNIFAGAGFATNRLALP